MKRQYEAAEGQIQSNQLSSQPCSSDSLSTASCPCFYRNEDEPAKEEGFRSITGRSLDQPCRSCFYSGEGVSAITSLALYSTCPPHYVGMVRLTCVVCSCKPGNHTHSSIFVCEVRADSVACRRGRGSASSSLTLNQLSISLTPLFVSWLRNMRLKFLSAAANTKTKFDGTVQDASNAYSS